jgi:hypothetical protein
MGLNCESQANVPTAGHIAEQFEPGARTAFSRHDGIYRPMSLKQPNPGAEADCLPLAGPEAQVEERAGRNTLLLIVRMSSGRLSLDRVGRHHCPSPFHRHGQVNTHSQMQGCKGDISTLHRLGTFLLCVDTSKYFVDTHTRKLL